MDTSASELDTQTETATESEATPEEKRVRDIRKLKKMLRQVTTFTTTFTHSPTLCPYNYTLYVLILCLAQ